MTFRVQPTFDQIRFPIVRKRFGPWYKCVQSQICIFILLRLFRFWTQFKRHVSQKGRTSTNATGSRMESPRSDGKRTCRKSFPLPSKSARFHGNFGGCRNSQNYIYIYIRIHVYYIVLYCFRRPNDTNSTPHDTSARAPATNWQRQTANIPRWIRPPLKFGLKFHTALTTL